MNSPTIVTFANAAYIPVARNWLSALQSLSIRASIRIIALDAATRDAFPAELVIYRPYEIRNLSGLWQFRVTILRELLLEADGIIHSDADAVWMKNPLPAIESCSTDMVFSQGSIWPPDVHARHGIVVCCGLFYLKNVSFVQDFMEQLENRVSIDQDDQVSVNRLLDESGVTWDVTNPYIIPFRDTEVIASRQPIFSTGNDSASVAILPHHLFPRLMDAPHPNVIVAHPLSPKNCSDKIAVLSRLGLWL